MKRSGMAVPSTALFGFCIYCKKPINAGHISGPRGPMHWGCYRDDRGHPFNPAYWRGESKPTVQPLVGNSESQGGQDEQ